MKKLLGVAVLLALPGCSAKWEATSGEEFLEKFKSAAAARDGDTIWMMLSAPSRQRLVGSVRAEVELAQKDPDAKLRLRKAAGIDTDPTAMEAEKLAILLASRPLVGDRAIAEARFKEERKETAKIWGQDEPVECVVLVVEVPGGATEEWLLQKEGKYLKWDLEATARRAPPAKVKP